MTLPSSGPLSLAMIRGEFAAPAGTPLHAFVRGGAWVPDIALNAGVPTAPPLSLSNFHGATKYVPPVINGPTVVSWGGPAARPPIKSSAFGGQSISGGNTGGTASWARVSGSTQIQCTSPTVVATQFSCFGALFMDDPVTTQTAVWRLTYSDGVTTLTKDLTLNFSSPA